MFLNDKKGSLGCFSEAGKRAFRIYKNLVLDPLKKKRKPYNIIDNLFGKGSQELLEQFRKEKEAEEKIDIFKLDDHELKKLKELSQNEKNRKNKMLNRCQSAKQNNKTKLKFYNEKKRKKNRNEVIPNCTKYNPKYDIILKRSPSNPLWSSLTSRPNHIKEDNFPFYIIPKNILENTAGKTFIDMSKQTKRKINNDDNNNKHNRPKSTKNLKKSYSNIINVKNKSRSGKQEKKLDKNLILENSKEEIKNIKKQRRMTPLNNNDNNKSNISMESIEDSYEEFKKKYIKQIKRNSKSIDESKIKKEKRKKKNKSSRF